MKVHIPESEIYKLIENKIEKLINEGNIDEGFWDAIKGGFNTVKNDVKTVGTTVKDYGQKVATNARQASLQGDAEKAFTKYRQTWKDANQAKAAYNAFVKQGIVSKDDVKNQQVTNTNQTTNNQQRVAS